ncbi:MAG: hypothetical protein LKE52_04000 [Bacilli bacterium]|jgi:hypothetical protein|nr:hypothetical protein [Bacilli bacterium]
MSSDEIGKRYGHLTVIKDTGKRVHQTRVFLCRCDCGNLKEVNINKLHSGHTTSCGCQKHRIKDLTGQRFGRLTVVSLKGRKNNKTYWNCHCDCGKDCVVSTTNLTMGQTVSCGCRNKENQNKIPTLKNDFVDGTSLSAVKASRKRNRNNTSGCTGVHWDKERGKWVAQIMLARKNHLIGRFDKKADAIRARKEAEMENFEKYRNKYLGDKEHESYH